jgi:peptidoglycan/xylan/chitin deacetylase (PgdA/CDA1 family)
LIKRLGWIIGSVLILFLFVAFAGINQWIGTSSRVVSTVENEMLSVDPNFNLETRKKVTNTYRFSIRTLLTESEHINQSIQAWIKKEEDRFLVYVEKNKSVFDEDHRAQLHIHVNMNKVTNDLHSVTFDLNEKLDEGRKKKVVKTFNMDLVENKVLILSDVLNLDDSNLDGIRLIIKEQLEMEGSDRKERSEWVEEAFESPDQLNWLITQDVLTIYFHDHFSPIKVDIPIEKLVPFLKEKIIHRLNIKIVVEKEEMILDPNGKYIALTFDDGPSPSVTPRILETLKEHHAKATFFMLGSQVKYHPELAKRVAEEGHEIGNHTGNHPVLTKLTEEQIRQEIEGTSQIIEEVVGQLPIRIRPPYGIYNEVVEKIAYENDAPIILWSVDSLDWKSRNAETVNHLVLEKIFPGSIVLLHDIYPTTADALPAVMTALKNEGYQFVTVSELLTLQEMNGIGPYHGVAY